MGVVVGVDGGNSKTVLAAATTEGAVLACVRGRGTNSHAIGAERVADVLDGLTAETGFERPADHGVFYLCGADLASDVEELEYVIASRGFAREVVVDNDTFALLRAGSDAPNAVAVTCGAGINVVGRRADGTIVRYPSLGWETGDWGGAEMLGRETLRLAARAEDGRGEQTALAGLVRSHFGTAAVEEVGIAVHYGRMDQSRLAELAPGVVAAAIEGDAVARSLVDRLASEIVLMAQRAFRDLGAAEADLVLGGGMLHGGEGLVYETVVAGLPAGLRPVAAADPAVVGAVLAALDAAGASPAAKARLREELRGR